MSRRPQLAPLPIDAHLPEIVAAVGRGNVVLVAEPGAGKTTRVPRALLDALASTTNWQPSRSEGVETSLGNQTTSSQIMVLEPRRIAARMAARRVAAELGEDVGRTVGYEVRMERKVSRDTRVRFVTEGVLARKLLADPQLRDTSVVVLDELHERNLHGDVALALLRRLQCTARPELRIIAMSATLDAQPVARLLEARVIDVPGRTHPVTISHTDKPDDRPLERRVASALGALARERLDGDVLVFLPGAAEIRRAADACAEVASRVGMEVALLHGDLPAAAQERAVQPGPRPKVILSTNVAESSLTIEGVTAVIDSGLARSASHSPWSGLPELVTRPISRASATQRAGRAGRMRPGRCVRLYSAHDHDTRPAHETPEIARTDLCETRLTLAAMDVALRDEDWLQSPPSEAWRAAEELLQRLGALDAEGTVTALGRRMAKLPLHPRLGRLLLEAAERGVASEGAALAALLSERDVWLGARARFGGKDSNVVAGPSDALDRLERFEEGEAADFDRHRVRALELDAGAIRAVARTRDRLLRLLDDMNRADVPWRSVSDNQAQDEALMISLLTAFPDRVAKRRRAGGSELVLARGGALSQAAESVVRDADLVVVLDARSGNKGAGNRAQLVSAIEPEWLLELFPERIEEGRALLFDVERERVERANRLSYDGLVLDESRGPAEASPEVEAVLHEAVKARGVDALWDVDAVEQLRRRVSWAAKGEPALKPIDDAAIDVAVRMLCEGKHSFAQLREASLRDALIATLDPKLFAKLATLAPERVRLPSGRELSVSYEADRPPWVGSYLQDFFGMHEGPRAGNAPLVLHLWAPNRRAVQVSDDLAGFWSKHYPALRRQLMRRYPKHAWPEDPLTAKPPERRGRRRSN